MAKSAGILKIAAGGNNRAVSLVMFASVFSFRLVSYNLSFMLRNVNYAFHLLLHYKLKLFL